MIWLYIIAAILIFAVVLVGAFLIALRFANWQDTPEDYDDEGRDGR